MRKNFSIWIALWLIVGVIGIYSIFNDSMNESKDAERALYAGKCYDINGGRCISFEQMKYIVREKMSSDEIDDFSQKCGLVLKEDKSDKDDRSSVYGFDDFEYKVTIIDNKKNWFYSISCHSNMEYVNRLRSDLEAEDFSAKKSQDRICSNNIEGLIEVSMNWSGNNGGILVSIMVEK